MFLTRKAEFSASPVFAHPAWSAERNQAVYGNNANPNGHGHNYVLEVTLTGDPDPVTGMVFDLRELKEILNREREMWKAIEPRIRRDGVRLHNVRLYETADLYVDYGGRDSEGHP